MARFRSSDIEIEMDIRKILSPQVLEPLQDVFVDVSSEVTLECKIQTNDIPIVTWYKDGYQLKRSDRILISYKENKYQLTIRGVTYSDYGLYTILCMDGLSQLYSKSALYVKPVKNHCNWVLSRLPYNFDKIAVQRHLVNHVIENGQRIKLKIELQSEDNNDFFWYKGNSRIIADERTVIFHDKKCSTLIIPEAKQTDSGLYNVMARTKTGVVSSFASVIVMRKIEERERLPTIEEFLPEEVWCNKHEHVRVMCKIKVDPLTLPPIWKKNETEISDNEKFSMEDYGNGYIGLKIVNVTPQDAAEYSVTIRKGLMGQVDSMSFLLAVEEPAPVTWTYPQLIKPLDSAIACFGAKVTMNCTFDLKYSKYFYVVWHVGRYRIERSNHNFIVICNDGDCILIIKRLEPEMAGLVSCELRRALPNRKSVFMLNTTANLAAVPLAFFDEEIKLHPSMKRTFCNLTYPKPKNDSSKKESASEVSGSKKEFYLSIPDDLSRLCLVDETLPIDPMEIAFCRPDEDSFTFVKVIKHSVDIDSDYLRIYDNYNKINVPPNFSLFGEDQLQKIIIEWAPLKTPTWFSIEFMQPDGFYHLVGVASKSRFEIRDAPTEKILQFRITPAFPRADCSESEVSISPPHNGTARYMNPICDLKTMQEFAEKYTKTGDTIGSGAYGTVSLVKDHRGELFAAKTIKTKSQKKRDVAMREFEMMKRLKHPKIVELKDAFMARDSFSLVMDYLWGGELFERIVEEEYIREVDVIRYVKQVCEALEYLHSKRIVHLDIKPENIVCLSPNSRQIKLIDFGLARMLNNDRITKSLYGTKDYVAPEVLSYEKLTISCDMWSMGVVTFMLLSGVMPFAGDTWIKRSANITKANYDYLDPAFKNISNLAKNFIDSLLVLNPDIRMDATMALCHPWIYDGPPNPERSGYMHQTRQNLKSYLVNHRARWQKSSTIKSTVERCLCCEKKCCGSS